MIQRISSDDGDLVERLSHLPVDRDTVEHYRAYLRRELVMNRCADCGRWHHPMRPMCPACWSWNVVPTAAVSGRGTVHLVTLLHQGPPADGVDYTQAPHPVVTVALEEQPGLRSRARSSAAIRTTCGSACRSSSRGSSATAAPSLPSVPRRARTGRERGQPRQDRVAIAGVGSTGFSRDAGRSALALALDAAMRAIRDAGLAAKDVDGVIAIAEPGVPEPQTLASALGLEAVTHWSRPSPVVLFAIADAVNAIHAGSADTVLVVSSLLRRRPSATREGRAPAFRRASRSRRPTPRGRAAGCTSAAGVSARGGHASR